MEPQDEDPKPRRVGKVAIVGDDLGHHRIEALRQLLESSGVDVIEVEREAAPTITITPDDFKGFLYKPNRKERRADAARARRRR